MLTVQLTQRIGEDGVALSQEVVKTVDLTIKDQDGKTSRQLSTYEGTTHVNVSSNGLTPSADISYKMYSTTDVVSGTSVTIEDGKDSDMVEGVVYGESLVNSLSSPSLKNSVSNVSMQKLNNGYDTVNVVDGEFKSAILKCSTLVDRMINARYRQIDVDIKPNSNNEFINTDNSGMGYNILPLQTSVFEPNKTYTFILTLYEIGDGGLNTVQRFAGKDALLKIGVNKALYKTSSSISDSNFGHNTQIKNSFKARLAIVEGDYINNTHHVANPSLTISNEDGSKSNILTVNDDVTLRLNGSVCDELDLLTGKLTQRIDEDGEILTQEVVKTVDLSIVDQDGVEASTLQLFNNGYIYVYSDSALPSVDYEVPTNNSYYLDLVKPNTQYTSKGSSDCNATIDGNVIPLSANGTFTTSSTITGKLMVLDTPVTDLMFIEGDVTDRELLYFEGLTSVENPLVVVGGKNLLDVDTISLDSS